MLKNYSAPWRIKSNKHPLKTIYIPIEIKYRELNSQVLLANQLVGKGARVYIGSKPKIHLLIECKKSNGGIYFYKGTKHSDFFKYIKTKCNLISILDQELSPSLNLDKDTITRRLNPNSIGYVSQYFIVNNKIKNNITKYHPELAPKTLVTGWPRVDIWKKYSLNIYKREMEQIKKLYGEYLLFSSDFGGMSRKRIEGTLRQAEDSGITVRVKELKKTKLKLEATLTEFLDTITWLKGCDNDPEVPLIIVRPHPGDDHDTWEKALNKCKKVKVIYKYDVTPWILQSTAVLHRGCTSAIEALIHEKPPIFIEIKSSAYKDNVAYKISDKISTIRGLKIFLNGLEKRKFEPTLKQKKMLAGRIFIEENMMASERIAENLLSLDVTPEKAMNKFFFMFMHVLKNLKNMINKRGSNVSNKVKKYNLATSSQKIPNGISKKEIITAMNAISKEKIKIKKVSKNLYCVSK